MRFRHEISYLIEAASDEINKLHLRHRPQPKKSHSASSANDSRLANGSFNYALASKFREQSFGGFKSSPVYADVFANRYHRRVAVHLFEHRLSNSLDHSYRGHVSVSRAYRVDFGGRAARAGFALLSAIYLSARVQMERAGLPALRVRLRAREVSAAASLPI